jgi:oligopeptide transport system ATP-binding protein
MSVLLNVKNLVTRFDIPEGIVHAVNGISFNIKEGETLAIVGESGCGKSVSMLSILGLIPIPPGKIESGEAIYLGSDLLKMSDIEMEKIRGKHISMIFQDPMTSLNPVLTIRHQLSETLCIHEGMSKEEAGNEAVKLLEWVGIPDAKKRLDDYPHQFSGGMRQRVMISMALSCHPRLLIADEPTTALDVTIQAQIVELVARLRDELNMAIIWITHDLGVVAGLAHRVIVMYAGYIVEEADVDSLYETPSHPYTLALMGALPRADRRRHQRLKAIKGSPPNLLVKPVGCPFAPRCEYAMEICWEENPALKSIARTHTTACWLDPLLLKREAS